MVICPSRTGKNVPFLCFKLGLALVVICPCEVVVSTEEFRRFASSNTLATVSFQDPGIPPPSFIYASGQLRPPYDIDVETMEPFAGCDASMASLCAVQHSIRLVTAARQNACDDIDSGGAQRSKALSVLAAGNYSLDDEGDSGFDVWAFSEAGQVLADPLRPDLVGEWIDGGNSSGEVPQPTLLDHIAWVARWNGGFVPHFSTRLQGQGQGRQDGSTPMAVVTYVEICPGSGTRLAVTFGRRSIPGSEQCNAASNSLCAWRNVQSLQGRMAVDLLTVWTAVGYSEVVRNIAWGTNMQIGSFYGSVGLLSSVGYPGPDPIRNPSGLSDSYMTLLAHGAAPRAIGENHSVLLPDTNESRDGLPLSLWLAERMARAAWTGGGLVDYEWTTEALGTHQKVSLVSGVVFNNTGMYFPTGAVHAPAPVVAGHLCTSCPSNTTLSCSLLNVESLVAHARFDMLLDDNDWDRLTYNPWFGASHADAEVNEYTGLWPEGFHVKAFTWSSGICVADGSNPDNIGRTTAEIFGTAEAHASFRAIAQTDGKWTTILEGGTERLAFAVQVRKAHETFYIVGSVAKAFEPMVQLDSCSSMFVEHCSTQNAEVLVGATMATFMPLDTLADAAKAGLQIQNKMGSFSSEYTGDFETWCYNADWECLEEFKEAGMACPPALSPEAIGKFRSALDGVTQAWTEVTILDVPMAAFVVRTVWKDLGEVDVTDLYFVSFLEAEPARDHCTTDLDCPTNAICSSGRCACDSNNFAVNNSLLSGTCGFEPAGMSCASVAAMDCTDATGEVNLEACTLCREGHFCQHGQPTICPAGQYCPAGTSSPIPCPPGSMTNDTGMSRCSLCPPGSISKAAASSCTSCLPGTFSGSAGQPSCDICADDSYSGAGQASCSRCPGSTYSPTAGATSLASCTLCPDGYAFKGLGICDRCSWGTSAPESDATVCRPTAELQIVLSCCGGLCLLTTVLILGAKRTYQKRSAKLRQKADAVMEEMVEIATKANLQYEHPMILVNVDTFMELTEDDLPLLHEGHRDAHRLTYIDSNEKYEEFHAEGNRIIFISYQWLSLKCKGLSNLQHLDMKEALAQVMALNRWNGKQTFVWLDIYSVPQDHVEVKKLVTDSLYSYLKSADVFLAVCCTAEPMETDARVCPRTYRDETFKRAELLAFCCGARGPDEAFLFDSSGLQRFNYDVILQMVHVFQGKTTCCARGHDMGESPCSCESLVMPLLGMYIDCRSKVMSGLVGSPGIDFFRHAVLPQKDLIFPKSFKYQYTRRDGRRSSKVQPLFGDLLERADQRRVHPSRSPADSMLELQPTAERRCDTEETGCEGGFTSYRIGVIRRPAAHI